MSKRDISPTQCDKPRHTRQAGFLLLIVISARLFLLTKMHVRQRRERLTEDELVQPGLLAASHQRLNNAVCVCVHRTTTHTDNNSLHVETTLSMTVKAKLCLSLRKICMHVHVMSCFLHKHSLWFEGRKKWHEVITLGVVYLVRVVFGPIMTLCLINKPQLALSHTGVMCSVARWFSEDAAVPGLRSGWADILAPDAAVPGGFIITAIHQHVLYHSWTLALRTPADADMRVSPQWGHN